MITRKMINNFKLSKFILDSTMCANGWLTCFVLFAFKNHISLDTLIVMLSINSLFVMVWLIASKDSKPSNLIKYNGKLDNNIKVMG